MNDAERDLIAAGRDPAAPAHEPVPWVRVLFQRNLLCLYLMYFGITYGWIFNYTYLPACLEERYGVEQTSIAGSVLKGAPLWLGAVGCLVGGLWTDRLLNRGTSPRWARRLPGLVGLVLCAGCYLAAAWMPDAWSFALAVSLAAFFNDLVIGGAWSTAQDVGGPHTAVVAGVLNTAASAGGALAGWISGAVLQYYLDRQAAALGVDPEHLPPTEKSAALVAGYEANLFIFAAVTAVAAVVWLGADAQRPLRAGEASR